MLAKYKSQKALKEHFQTIIKEIGVCSSIKNQYPNYYEEFVELFKRHPDNPEKTFGMIDLQTKLSCFKSICFYIIDGVNNDRDISYNVCITGKKNEYLIAAMRESIFPQTKDYYISHKKECVLCGSIEKIEVDHHSDLTPFKKLYLDFLKINKIPVPTLFGTSEGQNACFLTTDKLFETSWFDYHNDHVIFRMLCKKCNISQPKYSYE